jgi:hypothetical protein
MVVLQVGTAPPGMAVRYLQILRDFQQGVRVEADHLFAQPVVNMLHRFHHRRQLVDCEYSRRLLDVAE